MNKYNQELNNASIKARITRYQALEKQIDAILQQLYAIEYQVKGEEMLKSVYSDSYYKTWFNVDVYNGFHAEFAQVNAKTVEELINYPFNGANFSSRIWRQKDYMLQQLNDSITSMLIQGKDPRTLSKDFANKFNTRKYEAYRLLHTEGAFIAEQGTLEAYKQDGVEKYEILSTLDTKTSDVCRDKDGEIYDVDKAVTGVNYPPFHQFCRTTTTPHYNDMERETRVARSDDGKSYKVPAETKYREWYDEYIKTDSNAILAEKKWENRFADKKQYERYKKVFGKDLPNTLDDFQNLKYNDIEKYGILKTDFRKLNYYNKVISNEPIITSDLKEIALSTSTDLVGLEYRLKSKESFLRKVKSDSNNSIDLKVIDTTLDKTNDIIRYTYQAQHKDNTNKYYEINKELNQKGYEQIKLKNYWNDKQSAYKGINCNYVSPAGQKFEIQYHTPESFAIKNGEMHRLYEEWRMLPRDSDRRREIEMDMKKLSDSMIPPDNIERVK
ncbi:MAG TPA: head morphogenesis protein, partial [Clostridiales bacterium]|nr:head morphogenesis protein [Clostridiales bacterium]